MKKAVIITLALVMALCPVVLAACSSVNQLNSISVSWTDYEHYVYEIRQDNVAEAIGKMTYTFERILTDTQVQIGEATYTASEGAIISTKLEITSGEYQGDVMESKVLVKSNLLPVASFKKLESTDTARAYTSSIVYESKKVRITVNGKTSTFKARNCYDNESLYTLARASRLTEQSYGLSVAGVDNLQGSTRSVSMQKASNAEIAVGAFVDSENKARSINCYHVVLSSAAKYGKGVQTHIYFAIDKQDVKKADDSVVRVLKAPLKIVEGNYIYNLIQVVLDK